MIAAEGKKSTTRDERREEREGSNAERREEGTRFSNDKHTTCAELKHVRKREEDAPTR
jgi:hypothetical protein